MAHLGLSLHQTEGNEGQGIAQFDLLLLVLREVWQARRELVGSKSMRPKPIQGPRKGRTRRAQVNQSKAALKDKPQDDGHKLGVEQVKVLIIQYIKRRCAMPSLLSHLLGENCNPRKDFPEEKHRTGSDCGDQIIPVLTKTYRTVNIPCILTPSSFIDCKEDRRCRDTRVRRANNYVIRTSKGLEDRQG